ncbi:MAG: MoxR family ATPase [Deltaproteobacteria bacterium]|nr:MoxR family ATPase [Deltaproteobacteria bacterium]
MKEALQRVNERVVGRKNEILMIASALEAGKHIFLEGPPGTSKSTILKAIAESTGRAYCLVTGNSDLTTSKLIGYFDPAETLAQGYKAEFFQPGPLLQAMQQGAYLYIEEFNRLPDETTNVFITVMSEKKLTVPRLGTVEAHPAFRIIAALNPLDDIGISRISRALKDRFSSIRLDYHPRDEEIAIVTRRCGNGDADTVCLAVDIARETRRHHDLKLGSSIRGAIDMVEIHARAALALGNDDPGGEGLLHAAAMMAFRNKVWLYETSDRTAEQVLAEILEKLQRQKKN